MDNQGVCPFCGVVGADGWAVEHKPDCFIRLLFNKIQNTRQISDAELTEAWNTRTGEDAAVAAERAWISVEEQLPPIKSLVLVTDGHRRTLGCYKMRGGLRPAGTKDEPFWDTYRPYIIVTHWKPLPDPPESDAIRARGGE